jgi:hypothetical protein
MEISSPVKLDVSSDIIVWVVQLLAGAVVY